MFTRAVENRVFTITANRTGADIRDDNELSFTGESVIVSPRGEYLCKGSKKEEEICLVEINPGEALDKHVTDRNDIFEDRRKNFYLI
jgi:predicted amidohydrolase